MEQYSDETEQYSIYIPYDVAINTGRFQITVLKQGNTEQYSDETEQYTAETEQYSDETEQYTAETEQYSDETEQYSICIPYDVAINTGRFQITGVKQDNKQDNKKGLTLLFVFCLYGL